MDNLVLEGTGRTPTVVLDIQKQTLTISGESYPENVTEFYDQILSALDRYAESGPDQIQAHITLAYFNSGSAHALLRLARKLNDMARSNKAVTLVWTCHEEDDISAEFAEDILSLAPEIEIRIEKGG